MENNEVSELRELVKKLLQESKDAYNQGLMVAHSICIEEVPSWHKKVGNPCQRLADKIQKELRK